MLTHFVVEPFTPHSQEEEYYISATCVGDDDMLYMSAEGGMEVEEGWEEKSRYRELIELKPDAYQWGPLIFAHNTPTLKGFWERKWSRVLEVMTIGDRWITGCANHDTVRRGNQIELEKRNAERDKVESSKMKIDFGSQIRNYVLHPYKLVKDNRTGVERSDPQNVLDGDLDDFIKAYLMQN